MCPPHPGPGIVAVADWWLGRTTVDVLDVVAAAATPATTTDRAKIRIASFIVGTPSKIQIDRSFILCMLKS
jgi:hypothetical protein